MINQTQGVSWFSQHRSISEASSDTDSTPSEESVILGPDSKVTPGSPITTQTSDGDESEVEIARDVGNGHNPRYVNLFSEEDNLIQALFPIDPFRFADLESVSSEEAWNNVFEDVDNLVDDVFLPTEDEMSEIEADFFYYNPIEESTSYTLGYVPNGLEEWSTTPVPPSPEFNPNQSPFITPDGLIQAPPHIMGKF